MGRRSGVGGGGGGGEGGGEKYHSISCDKLVCLFVSC